jgi:hypothetical protein
MPATPSATESVVTRASTPFIVSGRFDAFFFFASVAAVVFAWIASDRFHVDGFYILATVAVIANGPHLTSTWTRVYFDKREWRTRPFHIFVMPVFIAAFVVYMNFRGFWGDRVLTTVLIYWATWHFLAQNWGLLRIYQKRSGEPDTSWPLRLERPLMYGAVLWCLLHRLMTGPRSVFGAEVYYLDIPSYALDALLVTVLCGFGVYTVLRFRERQQPWARTAWIRAAFLGCAVMGFFVPFICITHDGTTAFAAAACWHGFQYLGIVRFYHRNAWKGGVNPDAKIVSWVSQPGGWRLFWYVSLLLSLAGAGYILIYSASLMTRGTEWDIDKWGGVVWMSFTFSHYYLDGVIWKLRRDREVASRLLVQPVG